MDAERARKLAAARRYRLQVRLSLVRQQAIRDDRPSLVEQADALRAQVDAVEVRDDELETQAAAGRIAALEPKVMALQRAAGVPEHGLSVFPRWLEFTLWTSPFVLIFGSFALVFALRRRKREVDAEALAALDAAADPENS